MFGIGFMEMMVIAVILIIAVGPSRLPVFMKTIGKVMREFRRATRELRQQSGIDELMADDDLRSLKSPLAPKKKHVAAPPSRQGLDAEQKKQELPAEGVDFAVSREMAEAAKAAAAVPSGPGPVVAGASTAPSPSTSTSTSTSSPAKD